MLFVIPQEYKDYFDKEGFSPDPKNPYQREDGTVQHRFIRKDKKGHIIQEVWLNEEPVSEVAKQ